MSQNEFLINLSSMTIFVFIIIVMVLCFLNPPGTQNSNSNSHSQLNTSFYKQRNVSRIFSVALLLSAGFVIASLYPVLFSSEPVSILAQSKHQPSSSSSAQSQSTRRRSVLISDDLKEPNEPNEPKEPNEEEERLNQSSDKGWWESSE